MIFDIGLSLSQLFVFALSISAFFSATESAYLSLDRVALNRLERLKDVFSRATFFLRKHFSSFIITLLLMNMFANILATIVVAKFLEEGIRPLFQVAGISYSHQYFIALEIVVLVLFSFILIIFCEFFPKRMAIKWSYSFAKGVSLVVFPIYCVLTPVTLPLAWGMRNLINRMKLEDTEDTRVPVTSKFERLNQIINETGDNNEKRNGKEKRNLKLEGENGNSRELSDDENFFRIPFDHEQFLSYVRRSSDAGVLKEIEFNLLKNFINYKNMEVRSFMIPREPMKGLDLDKKRSVEHLKKAIQQFPYKNIPFYRTQKDNIVGVLSQEKAALSGSLLEFKTVLELEKQLEKPIIIPETKNILSSLKDILNSESEVALVSDEYGGIEGIVTYDDIIFSFFGRFAGSEEAESESSGALIKSAGNGFFRVSGQTPIRDVNEYFGTDIRSESMETLAGYLLECFKSIPKRYDTHEDAFFKYTVQERTTKSINLIIISRVSPSKRVSENAV